MNQRNNDRIAGPTTRLKVLLIVAAVVIAAGWLVLFAMLTSGDVVEPPPVVVGAPAETALPPSAETATADVTPEKLQGTWQRSDGDYSLQIRVEASGKLQATYLNPNPIHVAKAEAAQRDGQLTLLVELQDAGYPGSTYRLTYEPKQDQLKGTYLQATSGETFDVVFQRQP